MDALKDSIRGGCTLPVVPDIFQTKREIASFGAPEMLSEQRDVEDRGEPRLGSRYPLETKGCGPYTATGSRTCSRREGSV